MALLETTHISNRPMSIHSHTQEASRSPPLARPPALAVKAAGEGAGDRHTAKQRQIWCNSPKIRESRGTWQSLPHSSAGKEPYEVAHHAPV